ncbi:magnesium transporter [Geoglobus acetivorans]
MTMDYRGFQELYSARIRQLMAGTLPALLFCIFIEFIAGGVLGAYFEKLMESYRIVLVIIPGLMGLRGNIFGSMASRLTTMLHIGIMEPKISDKEVQKNILLSLWLSLIPVFILWAVGVLKVGDVWSGMYILFIIVVSTIFSTLIMGYSTAISTVIPYLRGLDPDRVAAPIITSVGDLITLPFLILFILIFEHYFSVFVLLSVISVVVFAVLAYKIKLGSDDVRTFKEVLAILGITSLIASVSGGFFEHYSDLIHASVLFSILYPAVAGTTGNFGAIVGAATSTRIHVGDIEGVIDRETLADIVIYLFTGFLISLVMNFAGIIIAKYFLGKNAGIVPEFIILYPLLLLTAMVVAYYIARFFGKLGFDPDNATVPMITTISDLMSVIFVIFISGVIVGSF